MREIWFFFCSLVEEKKLSRVFCLVSFLSRFALFLKKTLDDEFLSFFSRFCFVFYAQESHVRVLLLLLYYLKSSSSSSIQER